MSELTILSGTIPENLIYEGEGDIEFTVVNGIEGISIIYPKQFNELSS